MQDSTLIRYWQGQDATKSGQSGLILNAGCWMLDVTTDVDSTLPILPGSLWMSVSGMFRLPLTGGRKGIPAGYNADVSSPLGGSQNRFIYHPG